MNERDDQLKTQLQLRDEYFAKELKRRDQNLEDELKKRDEEWKVEIEEKDIEWRTILRDRDNALKASMDSRDSNFMNSLGHCKQSFCVMSFEIINNKTLLESLAMRQRELTKSNAKILDWAMKTVSSKKKNPCHKYESQTVDPTLYFLRVRQNYLYPILTQIQLEYPLVHPIKKQKKINQPVHQVRRNSP